MLYKGYSIKIWKSEWIEKNIDGLWYSLNGYFYHEPDKWARKYKYVALVNEVNPQQSREIWGGSTPLIAIDLAKFSIDLRLANCQRWDVENRFRMFNEKCLKERLGKLSKNI